MLTLSPNGEPLRILVLGAHSDDIEIGCGASMLRLLDGADRHVEAVRWIVFSGGSDWERLSEAKSSADEYRDLFARKTCKFETSVLSHPDGQFPTDLERLKEAFEHFKTFAPNLIFTHYKGDAHQDHRTIAEITYQTFRNHMILEYEIPKSDGDLGNPNFFITVTERQRRAKIGGLMKNFASQAGRSWFTPETFDGLMRLRGVNGVSPTGYAEGFYSRRISF